MEIGPTVDARHLRQDSLNSPVDGTDVKNVAAAVGAAPNANGIEVDLFESLRKGDGIGEVTHLLSWDNLLSWQAFLGIAIAKASVIIYKTNQGKLRHEVLRKSLKFHFLEGREAMRHN